MRNKQKAWRLGAAILNHLTFIDAEGRERRYPAARHAKQAATLVGINIRLRNGSSSHMMQQGQRFQPSGYVAPRRNGLRGDGFIIIPNGAITA